MTGKSQSVLFAASLTVLIAAAGAPGQVGRTPDSGPRTVRDFFLLVPDEFMGYSREDRADMLRRGEAGLLVDIKNGYISYKASDNPEEFEFCIFKKPDGSYLVAYSTPYQPDFEDAFATLDLLTYENGRWRNVREAVLPVPFNKRLDYRLPRYGTTIVVTDYKGRRQYSLAWVGGRFVKQ